MNKIERVLRIIMTLIALASIALPLYLIDTFLFSIAGDKTIIITGLIAGIGCFLMVGEIGMALIVKLLEERK